MDDVKFYIWQPGANGNFVFGMTENGFALLEHVIRAYQLSIREAVETVMVAFPGSPLIKTPLSQDEFLAEKIKQFGSGYKKYKYTDLFGDKGEENNER